MAEVVADCERAARMLSATPEDIEDHLRETPGLNDLEIERLVETFRGMRKVEPLGEDFWRRRKRA